MEKPTFTLEQILQLELPPIIIYAAPFMITFAFLEYFLRNKEHFEHYDKKDAFAGALVGIGNLISTSLSKAFTFGAVLIAYNMVPWFIPINWWTSLFCLIALDFCRYWAHRISHEQRFWWSTHVTHHSSEQYNFSVAFRLSWIQQLKIIFFLPVAFAGFHPVVFFICHQIAVLYQFWLHTELIKKLPRPIEYLFVTPSHHRVHHGTDGKYLDKNYGSTFIVWDRMFGTFQQEEETPHYGILKPVGSYNPVYLVFHEALDILRDMKQYPSLKAWWLILFGSPGLTLDKSAYANAMGKRWQARQRRKEELS